MSDLSVSSAASSTQQSSWAQRKTLFDQLGQALQKGDLKAAQTAFAALQKNAPQQGPTASDQDHDEEHSNRNPLAAVGQALQSGDLAGAQQAFAQIPAGRGHHHHRHHEAKGGTGGTTPPPTTPTTPSTTPSTTPPTTPSTPPTTGDKDGDHDGGKDDDKDEARKSRINLTA